MSLNIAQLFMKEMVKNYFGLLKIQVKFLKGTATPIISMFYKEELYEP